jgi:cytochrome c-type biogenesis protein
LWKSKRQIDPVDTIFTWLSDAMNGAPWLAVLAAAGWGVASLVLSPCHLASIPLIVGFIAERKDTTPKQALGYAFLFALGILLAIAVVGCATAAAGRMVGDVGPWANYAVAVVLVLVGLHLLGVLTLSWEGGVSLPRYQGKAAALLLGLIFGVALGPCTFAYLAPVLGVVFGVAHTHPGFAAILLLAYGIGHCALIVAAGVSAEKVQQVLNWNSRSRGATWLRRICGLLVLAGAAWLVYTAR